MSPKSYAIMSTVGRDMKGKGCLFLLSFHPSNSTPIPLPCNSSATPPSYVPVSQPFPLSVWLEYEILVSKLKARFLLFHTFDWKMHLIGRKLQSSQTLEAVFSLFSGTRTPVPLEPFHPFRYMKRYVSPACVGAGKVAYL